VAGPENRSNPALPLAAFKVLDALLQRVERLVDLPLPPADAMLVGGAASCLGLAVLPGGASASSGGAAAAAAERRRWRRR